MERKIEWQGAHEREYTPDEIGPHRRVVQYVGPLITEKCIHSLRNVFRLDVPIGNDRRGLRRLNRIKSGQADNIRVVGNLLNRGRQRSDGMIETEVIVRQQKY